MLCFNPIIGSIDDYRQSMWDLALTLNQNLAYNQLLLNRVRKIDTGSSQIYKQTNLNNQANANSYLNSKKHSLNLLVLLETIQLLQHVLR